MFPEQGLAGPQTVLMALLRICISCPGQGWVVVMRPSSNIARHVDMQTPATAVRMGLKAIFSQEEKSADGEKPKIISTFPHQRIFGFS